MEIITRRQAIDRKSSRYYSGVPCKFGHISERYTINACCIECLHPKFEASDITARRQLRVKERHESYMRQLALNRMERLKLGVHTPDLQQLRDLIYALAQAREPLLRREDIQARCKPLSRGPNTFLHAFWIYPEDRELIIAFNKSLTCN